MDYQEAYKEAENYVLKYTASSRWSEIEKMEWTTAEMMDVIAVNLVKKMSVTGCCVTHDNKEGQGKEESKEQ